MGHGRLYRNEVICPRHAARFDVTSGAVLGPPAIVPIDTFEVKVEGEDIYVLVED
jgi:3-phenylpropionate/trans-cinnamate dioxygenase ferredoxin subunit